MFGKRCHMEIRPHSLARFPLVLTIPAVIPCGFSAPWPPVSQAVGPEGRGVPALVGLAVTAVRSDRGRMRHLPLVAAAAGTGVGTNQIRDDGHCAAGWWQAASGQTAGHCRQPSSPAPDQRPGPSPVPPPAPSQAAVPPPPESPPPLPTLPSRHTRRGSGKGQVAGRDGGDRPGTTGSHTCSPRSPPSPVHRPTRRHSRVPALRYRSNLELGGAGGMRHISALQNAGGKRRPQQEGWTDRHEAFGPVLAWYGGAVRSLH